MKHTQMQKLALVLKEKINELKGGLEFLHEPRSRREQLNAVKLEGRISALEYTLSLIEDEEQLNMRAEALS